MERQRIGFLLGAGERRATHPIRGFLLARRTHRTASVATPSGAPGRSVQCARANGFAKRRVPECAAHIAQDLGVALHDTNLRSSRARIAICRDHDDVPFHVAVPDQPGETIPPNAYAEGRAGQWDCERGFRKDGDRRISMNVPGNAHLSSSGLSWSCDRGFRRERDSCIKVIVPANAYAEDFEYSRGWECNRRYRRVEQGCVRVSVPANAYEAGSTPGFAFGLSRRRLAM
jgi:hypothetical protein